MRSDGLKINTLLSHLRSTPGTEIQEIGNAGHLNSEIILFYIQELFNS